MQKKTRTGLARLLGAALTGLFIVLALIGPASAATTGSISGTVTDTVTRKAVAGAVITASSPSGRATATSDANGFYNVYNLSPDTYAVSIAIRGYQEVLVNGVTVVQDQNVRIDQALVPRTLQTIGRTSARSASNLVQPSQTADVYNVSPQQLTAAAGIGGHRTLYDVIQTSAGITSTGVAGRPRIRGGDSGDLAWEFDGIPINDRLTGLFTTNLSIVGTQSLEVYTGGYNAQYGNAGTGVINSVVKRGTYPSFGSLTYTMGLPLSEHDLTAEYGGATPNNKFSWYGSLDQSNGDSIFGQQGYEPYVLAQALTARDTTPSLQVTRDAVVNLHWRPSGNDDIQFLAQTGNQRLPWNKGLLGQPVLGITACNGVVVAGGAITNPGVSSSGLPCQVAVVNASGTITGTKLTGLQYYPITQANANVWYHWSNLGKIQWNHVFNDKLFAQFRLAENFNQYIFNQPFSITTINGVTTPNAPFFTGPVGTKGVPVTAYAPPGTPAAGGNGYQDEFDDRRSQMYFANLDFTYTANAHSSYQFGISYERDNSAERYFDNCGCDEASGGVGGFNMNGSFPNLFLQIDYPLYLPSAYFSTKQTFGKLTLEPGLRYDAETYAIPNRPDAVSSTGVVTKSYAYGPYSTHAFSPRFAFTWAASPYDSIRGSYALTTTFVPAAYVFNDSPNGVFGANSRFVTPYYPGATLSNPLNYNLDLSYSHALRNGIDSFRISPFYRHSTNKLELSKNYVANPVTGLADLSGSSYFRTGISNKATGAEFGWNHVVRGDGLSFYVSGTYVNYWGSVTNSALAGGTPYGGITSATITGSNALLRQFLATGTLFRNPSQPPWSISWTGDYRKGRAHVDPFVLYQVGAPYNVAGNTCTNQSFSVIGSATNACPAALNDSQVHFARANYWAALDFGYDVVKSHGRTVTIGMNVRNLLDQQVGDVFPSTNTAYPNKSNPDLNTYGPSSVPNTLYYYAPDQTPRQIQLYISTKF
jgi:hypothetical protein